MPKKRAPKQYLKPSSPAHPSLSSSIKNASHSLIPFSPTDNAVSERIQQLRLEQNSACGSAKKALEPPPAHAILLQIPMAPPPRPRPGLWVFGGRRGLAGPRPPESWTKRRNISIPGPDQRGIGELPGTYVPLARSLLDLTLIELARNWGWHCQYDQYYLATLPVRYKEALLRYIALFNPLGIDGSGLEILVLDESELEGATGTEGFTHLELAGSIAKDLSLKDLRKFFVPRPPPTANQAASTSEALPDDWETFSIPVAAPTLPRFHSITHLSLSHPFPSITPLWKPLLDLSPSLLTLTHLSLAHWPPPTLTPNSSTAYTRTPTGAVTYSSTSYYSAYDNDWSEAGSVLRRLGKNTLCLQWLDLTGCWPWVQCLADEQVDWGGAWAGLDVVRVGQGWVPECLQGDDHVGVDQYQRWRDVWESKGELLGEEGRKRRELPAWAVVEKGVMDMESRIRQRISGAGAATENTMPVPGTLREEIGTNTSTVPPRRTAAPDAIGDASVNDEWSRSSSQGPKKHSPKRPKRIRFEKDWCADWVKEAVEVISKKGFVE